MLAVAPSGAARPVVLDAEELHLAMGESALVPARVLGPPAEGFELFTNLAACVGAVGGDWDHTAGFRCVLNVTQPMVALERGDLVGAAAARSCRPAEPPSVAHVWRNEDELQRIFEVEMPPREYYEALDADMRRRHPRADVHLLEHLAALEPFWTSAS